MPVRTIESEICIIGAGPAGATTARTLALMGIPHLIVDAEKFPRDKICGDGLDLKVFRVLRHLDPDFDPAEFFTTAAVQPAWGARFITPAGQACDYPYLPRPGEPPYPLFGVARRWDFDHYLVQKFDPRFTNFQPGARVDQVIRDGRGWRILAQSAEGELDIRAPLLVGADGDRSVVLRSLGMRKIDRQHYAGTLRQYWQGVSGIHPQNLIEVYFPTGLPMSYLYIFPLPDGQANVGYGMVSSVAARGNHRLRAIFQRLLHEDPVLAPRFEGAIPLESPVAWGLPLASLRRRASGNGYLLVGDAASLICPTTGEGIGTGMMSGYIAAHFLQKALRLKRTDAAVFDGYDREIYRRLSAEIRQYNILRRFLPAPVYEWGLNRAIPTTLLQAFFQRQAGGWLRTAYERPIEVRLG